jgi:hypothetical protein
MKKVKDICVAQHKTFNSMYHSTKQSKSDKKMRIVIAFEHREGKSGRGYAKVIEDYSTKSLKPLFDTHIKNDASILADNG